MENKIKAFFKILSSLIADIINWLLYSWAFQCVWKYVALYFGYTKFLTYSCSLVICAGIMIVGSLLRGTKVEFKGK